VKKKVERIKEIFWLHPQNDPPDLFGNLAE